MPRLTEQEYADLLLRQNKALKRADLIKKKGLGQVPEQTVLNAVRLHARINGWLVYHTHDSRKSERGFPDIVATNGSRLLFAELKRANGKLTVEQERWIQLLDHTGKVDAFVWRPEDIVDVVPNYFRDVPDY